MDLKKCVCSMIPMQRYQILFGIKEQMGSEN